MSAYIARLKRDMDPISAPAAAPSLRQRFIDWYADLPEIARRRPFAMVEFERGLNTQGKYVSPILVEFGWRRGRRWSSQAQYNRYWLPPTI